MAREMLIDFGKGCATRTGILIIAAALIYLSTMYVGRPLFSNEIPFVQLTFLLQLKISKKKSLDCNALHPIIRRA